jgi:hypothetical protein
MYAYSVGFSLGPSLTELHTNQSLSVITPYLGSVAIVAIVFGSLFILGLWSTLKNRKHRLFLLLLLIMPISGVIILNKLMPNITYNVRYAGIALFGYFLYIALGLDYLGGMRARKTGRAIAAFCATALVGLSMYSYVNYHHDSKYAKPDIRTAASYIDSNIVSGDVILCVINSPPLYRYSSNINKLVSFPHYIDPNNRKDVESYLEKLVAGKNRLWLTLSNEWFEPELVMVTKKWLDNTYAEIEYMRKDQNEIANVRIYVYDLTKRTLHKTNN